MNYKTIVDQAPTEACYPLASIRKRLGEMCTINIPDVYVSYT